MSSFGGSSSVGGESSTGSSYDDGESNADENITHTRGVIDDLIRNLTATREKITEDNWESVAGLIDDADEIVEQARSILEATS